MALSYYNYLPYPISEYGPYRALAGDDVLMQLARKDQACWNLWYLSDGCVDAWHKLAVLETNPKRVKHSKMIANALAMRYRIMEHQFDGATIRHQVMHLPPSAFMAWFEGNGGYAALPYFNWPIASTAVSIVNKGLQSRRKIVARTAHVIGSPE